VIVGKSISNLRVKDTKIVEFFDGDNLNFVAVAMSLRSVETFFQFIFYRRRQFVFSAHARSKKHPFVWRSGPPLQLDGREKVAIQAKRCVCRKINVWQKCDGTEASF
jgi:hypothetical protein